MQEPKYSRKGWLNILAFIIPYLVVVGLFQYTGMLIAGMNVDSSAPRDFDQRLIIKSFDLIGTCVVLFMFMTFVDKKPFKGLGFSISHRSKEIGFGLVLGLLIMLTGYSVLLGLNEIRFVRIHFDGMQFFKAVVFFILVAFIEEMLFRGYILRNLMLSMNKYIALLGSSLVFALMHAFNPNVSMLALFNIFLAGILLGLSYVHTKNLWFPIALHFSWNFFQSVFGFNVSGQGFYSVIQFKINTESSLNGGAFGFEGSWLSVVIQLLAITGLIWYYTHKKKPHTE